MCVCVCVCVFICLSEYWRLLHSSMDVHMYSQWHNKLSDSIHDECMWLFRAVQLYC